MHIKDLLGPGREQPGHSLGSTRLKTPKYDSVPSRKAMNTSTFVIHSHLAFKIGSQESSEEEDLPPCALAAFQGLEQGGKEVHVGA